MCSENSKQQRLNFSALAWQLSSINKNSTNLFVQLILVVSVKVNWASPTQHLDNPCPVLEASLMTVIKYITSSQNPQTASRSPIIVANTSFLTEWRKPAAKQRYVCIWIDVCVWLYRCRYYLCTQYSHPENTFRSWWTNTDFVLLSVQAAGSRTGSSR